jgi:hypothetical protein
MHVGCEVGATIVRSGQELNDRFYPKSGRSITMLEVRIAWNKLPAV